MKKIYAVLIAFVLITTAFVNTVAAKQILSNIELNIEPIQMSYDEIGEMINEKDIELFGLEENLTFEEKYFDQLDENSKHFYNILLNNISALKTGTEKINMVFKEPIVFEGEDAFKAGYEDVYNSKAEDIYFALSALDYDKPDLFWMNLSHVAIGFSSDENIDAYIKEGISYYEIHSLTIKPVNNENSGVYYNSSYSSIEEVDKDMQMLEEALDTITSNVEGKSVYEKVEYFNRYLIDKNEYNRYVINDDNENVDYKARECVSALIYGNTDLTNKQNPLCEGYARALKLLCNKSDIGCILIGDYEHMWNYIKMDDGMWYGIDATWNDPVFNDGTILTPEQADYYAKCYFLQGESFLEKHTPNGVLALSNICGFVCPTLAKSDYSFSSETTSEESTEATSEESTETTSEESTETTSEESTETTSEESTETTSEESTETTSEESTETTSEENTETTSEAGDVDGNGIIELNDASALLQYILSGIGDIINIEACDIDNDGKLTANDASCILQKVLMAFKDTEV